MTVSTNDRQNLDHQAPNWLPNSDLEMYERYTVYHYGGLAAITDHFRGSALLSTWTWAGAPFVTPTVSLSRSILSITFAAQNRGFLYQAAITSNPKCASVSLNALTVGFSVGLRMDDGSDNNYAEVVLYLSQASPTQWEVWARYRAGGGAVSTAGSDPISEPDLYVLKLQVQGTAWTAWGFVPILLGPHAGVMWKPNTDLAATGAAWTPTRVGLIFDNSVAGSSWETGYVDWCDLNMT